MKTLPIDRASDILQQFIDHASSEAFKVEVLQDYYEHDKGPSLDAWLAGDKDKSLSIIKKAGPGQWHIDYAKRPIKKIRLHIVETPHSAYIDWEIELYKAIIIPYTGEKVSLVPKEQTRDLDLPEGDFWIIDDRRVVQFRYNGTKAYEGDVYDVANGDNITRFLKLKSELLKLVKPVE